MQQVISEAYITALLAVGLSWANVTNLRTVLEDQEPILPREHQMLRNLLTVEPVTSADGEIRDQISAILNYIRHPGLDTKALLPHAFEAVSSALADRPTVPV